VIFDWPVALAQNCFYPLTVLNNGTDAEQVEYTVNLVLTANETVLVNSLAFTRTLQYEFQASFLFSEYSVVSSTVTLISPVVIVSVIVNQLHANSANGGLSYVDIITQVGYPFALQNIAGDTFQIAPSGANDAQTTASLNSTNLQSQGYPNTFAAGVGDFSVQAWQVSIVPGPTACQIDGTYITNNSLKIVCINPASPDCVLPPTTSISTVFSISSENFCGQVVENIGVTLTLTSTDDSYEVAQDTYLIGPNERAYFKVTLSSLPTAVSVTSISVDRVTISTPGLPGGSLPVWLNNQTALDFQEFQATALETHFSFAVSDNSLFQVAEANKATLSVTARALITYLGETGSTKRAIVQFGGPESQTDYDMAVDVAIQPAFASSPTASSANMNYPLFILLTLLALLALWV